MCSNPCWSSGRPSRVRRSQRPPVSSLNPTLPLHPQTWAPSSCVNMSRYRPVLKKLALTQTLYKLDKEILGSLNCGCFSGPRCWCVWSVLSASHRDGPPTAVPDQENRRCQPTHSTTNLWSFLVLFPVRGNARNLLLACVEELSMNNSACINLLWLSSSIWWSSRRLLWGDRWGSFCCSSAAPKRSTANSGTSTRLTPTCVASRSFWRSRASSWGEESSQRHLAPLYSTTLSLIWWVTGTRDTQRFLLFFQFVFMWTFSLLYRWSTLKHVLK